MKWLGYAALLGLFGFVAVFIWFIVMVNSKITLTEPKQVVIADNSGTEGTATALYDAGVITSRLAFIGQVFLTGQRTELRSGTYTFSGEVNVPLVIDIVTEQRSLQNEVEVTLLEGWTSQQMGEALATVLSFTAEEYVLTVQEQAVEGYLFPDTYRFFVNASVQDVIDRQTENFRQKITPEMEAALTASGRTLEDAVILASIVEKEAVTLTDKQLVAGVFWKRLDNGKRLESDVTVNYLTGKTTVSYADAAIESAYNTYRNAGLPPGAVSNPGYDSLFAVAYPTTSEYWFFLATPEGEVKYAATYEEHLNYKNQYYP